MSPSLVPSRTLKLAFVCPYPRFTYIGGNVFFNDPLLYGARLCRYDSVSAEDFVLSTLEYRVPVDYCIVEVDNPKANFSFAIVPKKDYDPTVDYAQVNIHSDKRFCQTLTLPTRCPYGGQGSIMIDVIANTIEDYKHSFVGPFDSIVDIVPSELDKDSSRIEPSEYESATQNDIDMTIKLDNVKNSDDKTDKTLLEAVTHHPIAYGDSDSVLIRLDSNQTTDVEKRESKAPPVAAETEILEKGQEFSKSDIDLESQLEDDKLAKHLQAIQDMNGKFEIPVAILDKLITGEKVMGAEIGRDAQSPKPSAAMVFAGDKFFQNKTEPVFMVGKPQSGKAALLEMPPLIHDGQSLKSAENSDSKYETIDAPTLLKRIKDAFERQIRIYTIACQHNITNNALINSWSDFTVAAVLMIEADQSLRSTPLDAQHCALVSPRQEWMRQNIVNSDLVQFMDIACKTSDLLSSITVKIPVDDIVLEKEIDITELPPSKVPAVVLESLRKLVHFYRKTLE